MKNFETVLFGAAWLAFHSFLITRVDGLETKLALVVFGIFIGLGCLAFYKLETQGERGRLK